MMNSPGLLTLPSTYILLPVVWRTATVTTASGEVHRKALGYLLTQGLRCLALCLHFTDQRHRETAVRPHQQLQLQILLLPYGDLQYVAWMHGVRREFFRRNTKRYAPERQNDCNHAGHGVDPFLWKVEMSSGDCSMTLAYHTEGI